MNTRGVKSYFFKKKKQVVFEVKEEKQVQIPPGISWVMEPKTNIEKNKARKKFEEIELKSKKLKSVKLSNPPVWSDVYSLPFKDLGGVGRIYDNDNQFMFQFDLSVPKKTVEKFLEVINGNQKPPVNLKTEIRDEIEIWVKGEKMDDYLNLILIRGWGGLTGTGYGGRALSSEKASAIQDSLLHFINNKLLGNGNTN